MSKKLHLPRPKTPGQALLEFALALPVLLLLLFGIIEFGRLLQAWMAVQNAARFGLRYAVTGEYNPAYCGAAASALGLTSADTANGDPANDCHVPDSYGSNARDLSEQLVDWARLPSIYDAAEAGITGAAIDPSTAVSGDYITYLNTHDIINDLGHPNESGYFHVMVCSNRDLDNDPNLTPDFQRDSNTFPATCLQLYPSPQVHMDDAGGPGNRVRVTVTFIHPLWLPFLSNIWPTVPLVAWREGVVEKFRTSRISGLGSQISGAPTWTYTPTDTATPTNTPTPSDTPTPTNTATPTDTATPSPTPLPSCDMLQTGDLYFSNTINSGKDINLDFNNNNGSYPVEVTGLTFNWAGLWHDQVQPMPTDQDFIGYYLNGSTALLTHTPNISLQPGFSVVDSNLSAPGWTFSANQNGTLSMGFTQSFTSYWVYYHLHDFTLTMSYKVGALDCPPRTINGPYGPVVSAVIDPQPQNNIQGSFSIGATATDPDPGGTIKQVNFEVYDSAGSYMGGSTDSKSPYCLFGDSHGVCDLGSPMGFWPNSSNRIANGTYTIQIQAIDNDKPIGQMTRIQTTITINVTPCNTTGTGLLGLFYDNMDFTNLMIIRGGQQVHENWGYGSPSPLIDPNTFSVRWIGYIQPLFSEDYTIWTYGDDGIRVTINGQTVVSDWSNHSVRWRNGTISLERCQLYPITVEYYENTGNAVAEMEWSSASQPRGAVPLQNLYPGQNSLTPTARTPTPTPTLAPPTQTRTPTRTATPTNTPRFRTNTPTATTTRTPTPQPTKPLSPSNTPVPPTKTRTPTSTSGSVPATNTPTPPPTSTTVPPTTPPTPCLTPWDMGGCH